MFVDCNAEDDYIKPLVALRQFMVYNSIERGDFMRTEKWMKNIPDENTAVNDKYSRNSRQRGKIHNRSDASDILLPGYVRKKSAVVRSEVPRYTAYIES